MKVRNIFIVFLVSGFWHGANWTFIVWGVLNALYFLPLLLAKKNRNYLGPVAEDKVWPNIKEASMMIGTFGLTVLAWVFFRAENVGHGFSIISEILSSSLFSLPAFEGKQRAAIVLLLIAIFMLIEWNGRDEDYAIANLGMKWKRPVRYSLYYGIMFALVWFQGEQQEFIYFQF